MSFYREKTALQKWQDSINKGWQMWKAGEVTDQELIDGIKKRGEQLGMTDESITVKLEHMRNQIAQKKEILAQHDNV